MKLVFHFNDSYILWFTCLHSPRYFAVKTNDYYLALKVALDISFNNHRWPFFKADILFFNSYRYSDNQVFYLINREK